MLLRVSEGGNLNSDLSVHEIAVLHNRGMSCTDGPEFAPVWQHIVSCVPYRTEHRFHCNQKSGGTKSE